MSLEPEHTGPPSQIFDVFWLRSPHATLQTDRGNCTPFATFSKVTFISLSPCEMGGDHFKFASPCSSFAVCTCWEMTYLPELSASPSPVAAARVASSTAALAWAERWARRRLRASWLQGASGFTIGKVDR